jgi:hypothetical protein
MKQRTVTALKASIRIASPWLLHIPWQRFSQSTRRRLSHFGVITEKSSEKICNSIGTTALVQCKAMDINIDGFPSSGMDSQPTSIPNLMLQDWERSE